MEAIPPSDPPRPEPPLWSIGLAVVIVLAAPVLLYSLAPTGPLREGDTVFSDGQQRVTIAESDPLHARNDGACLLDPDHPMIIVQRAAERSDGRTLARVQANPGSEWPFCLPHTEVLVQSHQMFQKPAVFSGLQARLTNLIGGIGIRGR